MKLSSLEIASKLLPNGPTLRYLSNFYTDMNSFVLFRKRFWEGTTGFRKPVFEKLPKTTPEEIRTPILFGARTRLRPKWLLWCNTLGLQSLEHAAVPKKIFFEITLSEQQIIYKKFYNQLHSSK